MGSDGWEGINKNFTLTKYFSLSAPHMMNDKYNANNFIMEFKFQFNMEKFSSPGTYM
jgi:hypothetical protein